MSKLEISHVDDVVEVPEEIYDPVVYPEIKDKLNSLKPYIGRTISGKLLNHLLNGIPLLKFMNDDDVHYGMRYVTGSNKDILPFFGHNECSNGGIYVTTLTDCLHYIYNYGSHARRVNIEPDAKVYIESYKIKCDKVILGERIPKNDLIKQLIKEYDIDLVNLLKYDGLLLEFVDESRLSQNMIIESIKQNCDILFYINPKIITREILLELFSKHKLSSHCCWYIMNIMTRSDVYSFLNVVILELIENNNSLLRYVQHRCDIVRKILQRDGMMLQYINAFERIDRDHYVLYGSNPDYSTLCRIAVMQNGCSIMHICKYDISRNEYNIIKTLAVKQNGLALAHIDEQTDDLCLEAVRQNGLALTCVDKQTLEICRTAVAQDKDALCFVDDYFLRFFDDWD